MTRLPVLVPLFLLAALPACSDRVDVAYKRKTGEVRKYVRSLEAEGVNPSGTRGRARQEVHTTETTLEVIPGEQATVRIHVDRIVMEVYRGGAPDPVLRMDTGSAEGQREPAVPPVTEEDKFAYFLSPLRYVVGGDVEMDQRASGKILKMQGVEGLRKRMLEKVPEGDPRREVVQKFSWELWLTNLVNPAVNTPPGGLAVGKDVRFQDIRTLPETTGTGGYMYYSGAFRLAKVEDGAARMEMEATVTLDPPAPGMPPWPTALAARRRFLRLVSGSCKGWARIRVDTGVLEEDEHVTDLDLHFRKPEGGGEVAIPTKVTQRTKRVP
jgi:hypothetical protein